MLSNLPNELILDILEKMKINDLMNTCNTNKHIFSLCKKNIRKFSKIFLSIPQKYSGKSLNYVQDLDYYKILLYFVKNNLIEGCQQLPNYYTTLHKLKIH